MIRTASVVIVGLGLVAASGAPAGAEESWDAIYCRALKVGSTHVRVEKIDHEGRPLVRVQVNQVLSFRRAQNRTTMEVRYGSVETPDGAVLRLESRMRTGDAEVISKGDVVDGAMVLTLSGGGREVQQKIPWAEDVRGPYAAEMSLARSPMKPGESRDVKLFIPAQNKICIAKLTAVRREAVDMGRKGDVRDLLRVDQTMRELDGTALPDLAQTLWVDSGGQILRSFTDMIGGLYTYRTTKAAASAKNGDFDLIDATTVKVARAIRDPERTRDIRYRVSMKDAPIAEILPAGPRQSIVADGTNSGTLEVRTSGPGDGPAGPEAVGPEYSRPNPLINSDDPEVVRLMAEATAGKADAWSKAVAIEDRVAKYIRNKNFSTAFATASEVVRNKEGDCTEHGVLTAAMCRAAGIPARVAVGMVYTESLGGFGMHLWNEVYVDRRWVALDAAFNQSEVDAVHIKLSDSSLDGIAPFDAFLPVIRVLGKLTIEPVEVK